MTVQDGDSVSKLALVSAMESARFPHQVAHFVRELQRIKQKGTIEIESNLPLTDTFKEEFSGKKRFAVGEVEARCDHGLVVSNLERELRKRQFVVGNRFPMDLYILDPGGQAIILFEIKTDSILPSCYEAIGQLLFYSARLDRKPHLVAVFPQPFSEERGNIFNDLGIQCITYRWRHNQPEFDNSQIANWQIT